MLDTYLRAVVTGGAFFLGACILPVLAKWVLVGRWTAREIPLWSLAYLRFWLVQHPGPLQPAAAADRRAGPPGSSSPLYSSTCARWAPGSAAAWRSSRRSVPVCTDLLSIGSGTVIRKDAAFSCYRAEPGRIETGPVTIGAGAFVGEASVLDIGTSLGAHARARARLRAARPASRSPPASAGTACPRGSVTSTTGAWPPAPEAPAGASATA